MLDTLGIGAFDERVYRALLAGSGAVMNDITSATGGTPTRTKRSLKRLAELGLVRRTSTGRWEAYGPQPALAALVSRRRLEAESAFGAVEASLADMDQLYRAARMRSDSGSLVEVLADQEAIDRRIRELTESVTSQIWTLDRPPYRAAVGQPGFAEIEANTTRALIERGVVVRAVYCLEALEPPGRFDTVLKLATLGEKSRLLPQLPIKASIIDRKVALVPLIDDVHDSIVVVHPSGLLDALIELFEAYWTRADPFTFDTFTTTVGPEEAELSPDEIRLLRMLQAGLKDQSIARQLGISTRTATRRVAALMDRLGAQTRFQAGARAAARGWL
ncbi:LuxR C-terminal-related transcriptional regulator [Streptomyces sp. NPDC001675]